MGHRLVTVPSCASPLSSTDGVVDFLRDVTRAGDRGDLPPAHGVFSRAYLRMTLELLSRIADGGFEDEAWLARFIVDFAERYRVALMNRGARVGPWRIAMDRANRVHGGTIQHLVLGINAHMAYDLAMVLADSAIDDPNVRFGDYTRINALLAHAIDPVGKSSAIDTAVGFTGWTARPSDWTSSSAFDGSCSRVRGPGVMRSRSALEPTRRTSSTCASRCRLVYWAA